MKLSLAASSLLVCILVAAIPLPQRIKREDFPELYTLAPENPEWTKKALEGANVPNLALTTPGVGAVWNPKEPLDCSGNPNNWALTYDDGPSQFTESVVDHHIQRKIPATFFVTGTMVVQRPEIVKKAVDNGFEVAMHSWSHPWSTSINNGNFVAELVYSGRAIYQATGRVPRYIRMPYGDIDDRIRAILKSLDLVAILWNQDSNDAGGNANNKAQFFASAIAAANPNGVISLEHDLIEDAAKGINPASEQVQASSKYTLVTISQCLNKQNVGSPYTISGKFYDLVVGSQTVSPQSTTTTARAPVITNQSPPPQSTIIQPPPPQPTTVQPPPPQPPMATTTQPSRPPATTQPPSLPPAANTQLPVGPIISIKIPSNAISIGVSLVALVVLPILML